MSAAPAHAIAAWTGSPFGALDLREPWRIVERLPELVRAVVHGLSNDADYAVAGEMAIHRRARVEAGAAVLGPAVIGADAFVAATACVRGGAWIGARASIGRGCELKSVLVFEGSAFAHFNYVGDAIVGAGVNLEAGSIVCNHRNERPGETVRVRIDGRLVDTGVAKFGALIGDGCRIGANAVLAPGAWLVPGTVVARLALVDPDPRG